MTPAPGRAAQGMPLRDVLKFTMAWLQLAARKHTWGELRIVVQGGQILFVHEHASHRDTLPILDPATQAREPQPGP